MASPVSFGVEIKEALSEGVLARLVRLYQRIIREYMTAEQIQEEVRRYDLFFRKYFPISLYDHSPDCGELMTRLGNCPPCVSDGVCFWQFACPVRFTGPVRFGFTIEVLVVEVSGRVMVSHGVSRSVLEGDCFLPEDIDDRMDRPEVMEKCKERVRGLLTRLFAEFESQFQVVEKGKTSSRGFDVPWSANGVEWDFSG